MIKKILIALIFLPAILWAGWFIVPESFIKSKIENSVGNYNLMVEVNGLKKGFFYYVGIDNLVLKSSKNELITINNVKSRINPFYLLIFQIKGFFEGQVGGSGEISGHIRLTKKRIRSKIDFTNLGIPDIAIFRSFGIQGDGLFSGSINISDNTGYIKFSSENAKLKPFNFSGVKVPINFFQRMMGSFEVKEDIINIISFRLEGNNIYAKAKGTIKNNILDAEIELMPGKSFIENPLFAYEFKRYKVAPGYYVIPIRINFGVLSLAHIIHKKFGRCSI